MADYPSIEIDTKGSKRTLADPRLVDRMRDNSPKVRLLGEEGKFVFLVAHVGISDDDLATWDAFYAANRDSSGFNLDWYGTTYVVIFGDEKGVDWTPLEGSQWSATLTLLEA